MTSDSQVQFICHRVQNRPAQARGEGAAGELSWKRPAEGTHFPLRSQTPQISSLSQRNRVLLLPAAPAATQPRRPPVSTALRLEFGHTVPNFRPMVPESVRVAFGGTGQPSGIRRQTSARARLRAAAGRPGRAAQVPRRAGCRRTKGCSRAGRGAAALGLGWLLPLAGRAYRQNSKC